MTMLDGIDGLLGGDDPPDVTDPDDFRPVDPNGRVCAEEGCTNTLPDGSHPARKYCDDHFQGRGGRTGRKREGNTGERRPASVNVMVGGKRPTGGKADQRARDTAAGATAFMNVVAAGLATTGDQVCAGAVAGGAPQWGDAVGELSKYQPWLSTFFAPVGGDSQLGAWLGFMMATGAIALPVLAHHGLLPESVGVKMGGVFVAASDVADQPAA